MNTNEQAELFFQRADQWRDEYERLREIVRENQSLEEDYKWMHPCYTVGGKNVVLIHGFKEYCALLFHKGALINDTEGILIQQTGNVQSARQIRFTSVDQINALEPAIQQYIQQAIDIEKSGKKVEMKTVSDYPVPEEFQRALDEDPALNKAFHALTLGRQKGYLLFFNQAKQAKTRIARIEKFYQPILDGKGLDD